MTLTEAIELYAPDGILHLCSRDRFDNLNKLLSVSFDPELHYTMTYIHLHYAMLDISEKILDHASDKSDETYKDLEDYYKALKECDRSGFGVFPLDISYRNWWNGPHLLFPDSEKITNWFPLRVERVEGNKFHCVVAKKEEKITYGFVEFPVEKALSPPVEELMGEIAFYGDDFKIDFYREETWKLNPALQVVHDKAWPYIVNSNLVRNRRIDNHLGFLQNE